MELLLVDGHNDLPWAYRQQFGLDPDLVDLGASVPSLHTDLARLAAGGVKGQFWSVYVPSTLPEPQAAVATLEQIDLVHRMVERYEWLSLVTSADELERAVDRRQLASLLGVEGGHAISGSLAVLRAFHRLGVRYLTLTHNDSTAWAESATDPRTPGGLSDFGRLVVAELNRLGMLVDLAHVADATMRDAMEATRAPVVFSHSNTRAVCPVARNVPDDVLADLPANGGLVMLTFVPFFVAPCVARWMDEAIDGARANGGHEGGKVDVLAAMRRHARTNPPPAATVDDVVRHFDHVREMAGIDHIGIGGDFDGSDHVTRGLEDVSCYPRLFDELRSQHWSQSELDKVAGRNLLRVMRDVEGVAS